MTIGQIVDRKIKDLEAELAKWQRIAIDQQKVLDLCPGGLPNGTGMFSPKGFIKYAIKKLGYEVKA